MVDARGRILRLAPNRVWRNYRGGRILDALEGKPSPQDTHFPEDWLASTTHAVSAGREQIVEGISSVELDGQALPLPQILQQDPVYFLGARHAAKYGVQLMFLAKFLDSAVRLPIQTHPSIPFARQFLNSASGKTEAYHILRIREDNPQPYIFMGFQHPPSKQEFKRMVEAQDVPAMEACFEKIPIREGDTFYIPGGTPHAIGEGALLLEVLEPTDLCVRFDYKNFAIPEAGRFMNRGVDFALSMTDFERISVEEVLARYRPEPVLERALNPGSYRQLLIGERQTKVFQVRKTRIQGAVTLADESFNVAIVIRGEGAIETAAGSWSLKPFDRFLIPAGIGEYGVTSQSGLDLIQCYPPAAT